MRALVTGGAGFIGSHLVDALQARGDTVAILDDYSKGTYEPDGCPIYRCDVRELEWHVDEFKPQIVYHLAAQTDVRRSLERPLHDADVNVGGTVAVLEAARRHDAHVVLASTGGAIYGECLVPASEDDAPCRPLSPYGTSKLAAEAYLQTWNRLYGTRHTILRLGNVYGPRQDPSGEAGVVAIFASALRAGRPATIYGDGRQTRDYVYVDDVVDAFQAARGPGIYNIGTGVATPVVKLYAMLASIVRDGRQPLPEGAPARLGELYRSVLNPELARHELGWAPRWHLWAGLVETWAALNP